MKNNRDRDPIDWAFFLIEIYGLEIAQKKALIPLDVLDLIISGGNIENDD